MYPAHQAPIRGPRPVMPRPNILVTIRLISALRLAIAELAAVLGAQMPQGSRFAMFPFGCHDLACGLDLLGRGFQGGQHLDVTGRQQARGGELLHLFRERQ